MTDSKAPLDARWAMLVGLVAGIAGSALGVGGGLIMTPAFAVLMHLPIKHAVGTSLAVIPWLAASAVATELLYRPDVVHLDLGLALALGAVLGARLGFHVLKRMSDGTLYVAFAAFLLFGALQMARVLPWDHVVHLPVLAFLGVGFAAGIIASLFGVGGGILAVPLLVTLRADLTFLEARASSLVMIVFVSLTTTLLFARDRLIDKRVWMHTLPGAIVGAIVGIPLAHALPERPLRYAFAALLVFSAYRILWRTRQVASG